MKNIALILFSLCVSAWAAFQYEISITPYDNSHYEGYNGNYFTVNIISGTGTLYITDKINNLHSMSGNTEILSKVMSNYGYISNGSYVSGTGNTIIVNQYQHNQYNDLVTQLGYEVGTFSAGDSVGLWIANKAGTINTSIYTQFSNYGGYELSKKTDAFGTTLAEFDYTNSSPIFFGMEWYGTSGGGNTTGQPLPGIAASLLVGGGLLVSLGTRRKKRASSEIIK